MRYTISGLVAAFAVVAAGISPASACDSCSPCGYVSPCGQTYVQPYATYEQLPDPEVEYQHPVAPPQYYYVDQGPTYSGPGDYAPRRVYREEGIYGGYGHHWHHHHHWHQHWMPQQYGYRTSPHYGYRVTQHYGYRVPQHYGYHARPHVLHSYY